MRKTPWTQEEWNLVVVAFMAARAADSTLGRKQLVEAAQAVLPEERRMSMNGGAPFDRYNDIMDKIAAQEAAQIVASQPAKAARVVQAPAPVSASTSTKASLAELMTQLEHVKKEVEAKIFDDKAEVETLQAVNAKLTWEIQHTAKSANALWAENDKLKAKVAELQGPGSLTALVAAMKEELLVHQAAQTLALIKYFETGERPDGSIPDYIKAQATQCQPWRRSPPRAQNRPWWRL